MTRPQNTPPVTCQCSHRKSNHDPDCYWCDCQEFTPYREDLSRVFDWQGLKGDLMPGRVHHSKRPK